MPKQNKTKTNHPEFWRILGCNADCDHSIYTVNIWHNFTEGIKRKGKRKGDLSNFLDDSILIGKCTTIINCMQKSCTIVCKFVSHKGKDLKF